ncbi:MAG: type II secretion system protein GspE, partial [Candidatus Omnitrophota bacterium]
ERDGDELTERRHKTLTGDIFRGKGCEACKFTGFKGRTMIYEIMVINDELRKLILKKADAVEIKKKAKELGMKTMRECGWEKIYQGITTVDEVVRVTELE